jgi:hypothetical protein
MILSDFLNLTPLLLVVLMFCSIFRDRLQPAAEAQGDGADGDAAQPSLSLFGLMKEGRLSRSAAAMLFYQVCGELWKKAAPAVSAVP